MRTHSSRRKFFKKEIRKTFIVFALIPTAVLSLLFYTILQLYSSRLLRVRNDESNRLVTEMLEREIVDCISEIHKIEKENFFSDFSEVKNYKKHAYEELYNFANSCVIETNFSIFDHDGNIRLTNTWGITHSSSRDLNETGIMKKMRNNPDDLFIIVNRVDLRYSTSKVLSIAKAIRGQKDEISGYILFDLYEHDIKSAVQWNREDLLIITDSFYNSAVTTNDAVLDMMEKFNPRQYNPGYITINKTRYFITTRSAADGNILINTLSSMNFIDKLYASGILVISCIFILMSLFIFMISRRFADAKTKSLEKLLDAIKSVQAGNLDAFVKIETNDEFELLGSYYNKMIVELKELIRLNFEQTRQNKISELQQLEAQFNPHFLYNTLEMIKYLIKENPDAAVKTIVNMSQLLRYSIDYEKENVPLSDDISYIENYLYIQKMRFSNRFDYHINIDTDALVCTVPKLIIQPLIENSIKYGFSGKENLMLKVEGNIDSKNLVLKVSDNGAGIEADKLEEIKKTVMSEKNTTQHIGLFNVQKRIRLLYGEKYTIFISSIKNSGVEIIVELPVVHMHK